MRSLFFISILFLASTAAPLVPAQTATAPASDKALSGKWHFTFYTEGDDRFFDAVFTVDGNKVGGTFGKDVVSGTVDGEKFTLEFTAESEDVGKGTLKMVGTVEGDQLKGSWSFQTYTGTFKALRPKAAPAGAN